MSCSDFLLEVTRNKVTNFNLIIDADVQKNNRFILWQSKKKENEQKALDEIAEFKRIMEIQYSKGYWILRNKTDYNVTKQVVANIVNIPQNIVQKFKMYNEGMLPFLIGYPKYPYFSILLTGYIATNGDPPQTLNIQFKLFDKNMGLLVSEQIQTVIDSSNTKQVAMGNNQYRRGNNIGSGTLFSNLLYFSGGKKNDTIPPAAFRHFVVPYSTEYYFSVSYNGSNIWCSDNQPDVDNIIKRSPCFMNAVITNYYGDSGSYEVPIQAFVESGFTGAESNFFENFYQKLIIYNRKLWTSSELIVQNRLRSLGITTDLYSNPRPDIINITSLNPTYASCNAPDDNLGYGADHKMCAFGKHSRCNKTLCNGCCGDWNIDACYIQEQQKNDSSACSTCGYNIFQIYMDKILEQKTTEINNKYNLDTQRYYNEYISFPNPQLLPQPNIGCCQTMIFSGISANNVNFNNVTQTCSTGSGGLV